VNEKKNWRIRKIKHHLLKLLLENRKRMMKMKMVKSIILSNYLLVGMGNQFHFGCTSYTVLVFPSSVNYVVIATEVER